MAPLIPNPVINTAHYIKDSKQPENLENILHVVLPIMQKKKMGKNKLAKRMKVTPAYITQVFNGSKKLNMIFLAKLQEALNIQFKITAVKK